MDEKLLKYLYDVLGAVEEINSYFEGKPKLFEVFNKDLMLRRAVERNVEIMGEAMNRVLREMPDIPITNARKIVDTRNYIIHGYDSLSSDINFDRELARCIGVDIRFVLYMMDKWGHADRLLKEINAK